MKSLFTLSGFLYMALLTSVLQAKTLPVPTGKVILTVSGNITYTNTSDDTAEFDRQMLTDLGMVSLKTGTPWSDGVDVYQGPLLRSLIEAVGVTSDSLSVIALNDYNAFFPVQDGYDHNVILAMDVNGDAMRIRDKGPLFILYPFDEKPSLKNEVIYNRSVWQVKAINVE